MTLATLSPSDATATDAGAPAQTLSERLAAWGAGLSPADIPKGMREKTEAILVDVVGLCLAARHTDYVASLLQAAEPGRHVAIGHAGRFSAADAALLNGTAAHGEDFDDTFEGGPVHSGAVVVPAVLAAAEREGFSGERILLGIAAGTELLCRLGLVTPKAIHKAGFHPTAVLGALAAAFGVGVALGSDARALKDALGIAGSTASGIIEYLGDGSSTKRMHAGWAAQSGLRSALMGRAGFHGPRAVLEGEHGFFKAFAPSVTPMFDKLFDGLGTRWIAETITFKPYPCGTMVQPYIDCAIRLKAEGVPLSEIARIHCSTSDGYVHRLWEPLAMKRRPPTAYAAKFSIPFGVALGLARGHAGLADFSDAAIGDPALLDLAGLVTYEVDPADPYPARFTGHVRIETRDGRVFEARQGHMRGGVDEPLSRGEVDAKFIANARHGGIADPEAILSACTALLEDGPADLAAFAAATPGDA
ncbi:2-methylcitrate dehydratase [Aureimonas sp. Leaf454]|uniref:MmgE/PrpD family protein n=1 Tax=Aureimonas sp. Leaf454 TaxID=1736381 RepID=UPI0006F9A19D|nr:MmgE/PrpD family protein [Aureimonas sp. Leaf454]KQT53143.1 2-methylcitrate dehydratase [Aureimonas sp. Leaf454]